ncbi:hypothetical protein Bbelb_433040 [Branchiostoma belcheri]|nr:hypothetical protein Bbelb_433040 [Branchiostoma belcheri]
MSKIDVYLVPATVQLALELTGNALLTRYSRAAGRQNIQIVRRCLWLGGASDSQHHSLRPGWWAGPRLHAMIGAPERHVVCRRRGVYQRRCSLLSTCGFYGDTAWERPAQHWGPACPVS